MKRITSFTESLCLAIAVLMSISSCGGDDDDPGTTSVIPQVNAVAVSEISYNSVVSDGSLISDGGSPITDKGFCWSLDNNPTLQNDFKSAGSGFGAFSSTIEGLEAGTSYYIRAYATNDQGTGYSNEVTFTTRDLNAVIDIDGNWYPGVQIGDQIWMGKNLQTTRLKNGVSIENITDDGAWEDTESPAYSFYNNDGGLEYGLLYNSYTLVNDEVCPEGWHVPTQADWDTLIDEVGGPEVAGGKLKDASSTYWEAPNTGATDEFGFTALPAGLRYINGEFRRRNLGGYWWAASDESTTGYPFVAMDYDGEEMSSGATPDGSNFGASIRCVKDD